MRNITFFILIVSTFLFAIEIKILPDTNLSISSQEKKTVIKNFLEKHIKISNNDAVKYIKNNRILSNKFIEKYHKIPKELLIPLRLQIEENLANLYVQKKQKQLIINDEILESYYKTHPKQFITDTKISFIAYKFRNFDSALEFYKNNRLLHNMLLDKKSLTLSKSQINPYIAPLFNDIKEEEKTPPIFYGGSYVVFEIKKVEPPRRLSFQESRNKIRDILLQKTFVRTKKELLAQ